MSLLALPENPKELLPSQRTGIMDSLKYRWIEKHARESQKPPPGDWGIWLIKTGRGWGKTRTAGEWVCDQIKTKRCKRMHLVAATAADARDTMVQGESGILAISPPWFMPEYNPSICRLTWPNGGQASLFSAEQPDRLRGPHCDGWWADEMAAWKYLDATWDQLQFGAQIGDPRGVITTTPRPLKALKDIIADPDSVVVNGHMRENIANLSPAYIKRMNIKYEGSRLGRQELAGEMLDDNPNAMWRREWIDRDRLIAIPDGRDLVQLFVALDPSATSTGDEAGIIAAGKDGQYPPHFYILEDATIQGSPKKWATQAISVYNKHKADRLIYESNQGGEMVAGTIANVDDRVRVQGVHASRGKAVRAEPISTLSEQGRIHHVGTFGALEDELCEWVPGEGDSPNRLDALVWVVTALSETAALGFVDRGALGI